MKAYNSEDIHEKQVNDCLKILRDTAPDKANEGCRCARICTMILDSYLQIVLTRSDILAWQVDLVPIMEKICHSPRHWL